MIRRQENPVRKLSFPLVAIDLGSSVHRLLGYVCVDSYLGLREYTTPGQLTKIPL